MLGRSLDDCMGSTGRLDCSCWVHIAASLGNIPIVVASLTAARSRRCARLPHHARGDLLNGELGIVRRFESAKEFASRTRRASGREIGAHGCPQGSPSHEV